MNRTKIIEQEMIQAIINGEYSAGSQIETESELASIHQKDVLQLGKYANDYITVVG